MKTYFRFILVAILPVFNQCTDRSQENKIDAESITQDQIDSVLTAFNFEYTSPRFVDSSDYVLLPMTTNVDESRVSIRKSGSYYDKKIPSSWNILFYNRQSGEVKLLTESKINILDFRLNVEKQGPILSKSILYNIITLDYDDDGFLSYLDPNYLFISDEDGVDFRRLSPEKEDMVNYTLIPESDQIIIRTKRDINNNKKFDQEDDEVLYLVDIAKSDELIEIVDAENQQRIKNLFFDQWLKDKIAK